jgi:hypothetical protein
MLGKGDPGEKPIGTLLRGSSHSNHIVRPDAVSPSGIAPYPDVFDELVEGFSRKKEFADLRIEMLGALFLSVLFDFGWRRFDRQFCGVYIIFFWVDNYKY